MNWKRPCLLGFDHCRFAWRLWRWSAGPSGRASPTDFEGVLQDIHWYFGGFGYFPTYTLGAMAAAQLFAAAQDALPNLETDLAQGDFTALLDWLRTHIHSQGSLMTTNDYCKPPQENPGCGGV